MIVLPMAWLMVYSLRRQGWRPAPSTTSALCPPHPCFVDPLVTTLIISVVGERDLLSGRRADGLAGGAHRHAAVAHRAHPGDGLAGDAAVRRRGRLGDAGGAELGPAEPAVALITGAPPGRGACSTSIRSKARDLRHRLLHLPYVFILVANALDRMPGELEDASSMLGAGTWQTARRITVPLALPTLLAGALVAFLQALNLFGSPAILAIPAGFHTLTTKIWSLFQFPPKPELRLGGGAAAADPDRGAAARPGARARPARLCGARRQVRRAASHPARLAGAGRRSAWRCSCCPCRSSCPTRRCFNYGLFARLLADAHARRPSPCTMWCSRSGS